MYNLSSRLEDRSPYMELAMYRGFPRCTNCIHSSERSIKAGYFWKREETRLICTKTAPDLLTPAVVCNADAIDARTKGYCGIDGRLFEAKP